MTTNKEPLSIDPKDYNTTVLTAEQILQWFDVCDAGWMHDSDSKKPHAELASGKCSNGYFNCSEVFCYPALCEVFAHQLVKKLDAGKIDWVVSSSSAAITFGHEAAKALGAKFGYTEKDPNNPKKQIWKRFTMPEGSIVLQIEDLITTSQTFKEVRRTITERNSESVCFMNVIGALIHRPPKLPADYGDVSVVALVHKEVWAVEPKDCPLCAKGSKLLRPKTHWKELTGKA